MPCWLEARSLSSEGRYGPSLTPTDHALRPLVYFVALLICVPLFAACGGATFPGVLPPPPLWVTVDANASHPKEKTSLFAQGFTANKRRIDERRALAEVNSLNALKALFLKKIEPLMLSDSQGRPAVSPQELTEVKALINGLPWAQMTKIQSRFFDPGQNKQYALSKLELKDYQRAITEDPGDGTTKALAREYGALVFKSLHP